MKNNIPDGHVSKKKKNTYTVTFSLMINMDLFSACKHTPIALIMVNGKKQMNQSGWIKSREFPNPCANEMAKNHKETIDKMGPKLATTIIEYLDKKTNKIKDRQSFSTVSTPPTTTSPTNNKTFL